ncbi:MAG: damage repair protein [Mollicutes bacterium]|jgi:DNA polymerase V|nr:damage repair protein [Mollicutes bacterium]
MEGLKIKRNILCFDLKSFFAACECLERGLDLYNCPLVVADPRRGGGGITLAITPYLKNLGVKSRGRIYEIPKNIDYIIAKPRMNLYIKKSKEVVDVYLNYVSSDDLHIYSIDEVFIDVTNYLNLYNLTDYELSLKILKDIKDKTGLTATCGIGPNIFLAKVAMDIEAKHNKDNIAKWDYEDIETKLWTISPLSKVWGIGKQTEKKLNLLGIKTIGDLANYNKFSLKKKFGVLGEELWYRANGIDITKISDLKLDPQDKSFSHSQVLFKDYYEHNIDLIIDEMCDVIASRLRKEKMLTSLLSFGIEYSKSLGGGFHHSQKLGHPTDKSAYLKEICSLMFNKYYNGDPIRKVSLGVGRLSEKDSYQLNIFEENSELEKIESTHQAVDEIRAKYGKNSLIKASHLLDDSTIKERNEKVGGHNA